MEIRFLQIVDFICTKVFMFGVCISVSISNLELAANGEVCKKGEIFL